MTGTTPQLVFRSSHGERVLTLDRPIVVGRDASCDVAIDSVRLSRRHAEFSPLDDAAAVRDLGSKNGVVLNDERVEEGTLRLSDRVLLGDVAVTLRLKAPSTMGVPVARQATPRPGEVQAPPPDDATRRLPVRPAAPAEQRDDRTRLLPKTPAAPGTDRTLVLRPGRQAEAPVTPDGPPAALPAPPVAEEVVDQSVKARVGRRLGFGGRVTLALLASTTAAFVLSWLPLSSAAEMAATNAAATRAATIARLMVAENRVALAEGQRLSITIRSALAEPGVREALVLDGRGRVLAPAERLDERLSAFPHLGNIHTLQGPVTAVAQDVIEAAAVVDAGNQRVGIVWLSMDRAATAEAAQAARLSLLGALLGSLAVALVAALLVRRMIVRRLEAFAVDVDLAIGGRLDAVKEHQGLPVLGRLAESVSYLIERTRTPAPAAVPDPPLPAPAGAAAGADGTLLLDSGFVILDANDAAAGILQTSVHGLIGRHVLEAIQDQGFVMGIIDLLGELAQVEDARRTIATSTGRRFEVGAAKTRDRGSVRVVMRPAGAG